VRASLNPLPFDIAPSPVIATILVPAVTNGGTIVRTPVRKSQPALI
jgi:hypothetical protein